MLQSMRSAARWIWIIIAIVFVGGFVFYESSGLFGRGPVSSSTPVATVNGHEIPNQTYATLVSSLEQQQEQQLGRAITLDERKRIEDQAFDQLVSDALLQDEYRRRGIQVTDEEIREAAQVSPPPQLMQAPELQTDGRFDVDKYQRFLHSPAAREQGLLLQLENYYRTEIPRQKLFEQVTSDVYVTEPQLWQLWRDGHDSAQITYIALRPEAVPDNAVSVSDDEIRTYYDRHADEFVRPGRAVVSVVSLPRTVTAADSGTARNHALALRQEIVSGKTSFDDVAKRESADSGSAAQGGVLPRGGRGRFVPEFERAAYALTPGEVSQPVLTQFGYHLIRVDEKKGDTLAIRHILVPIHQSDTAATRVDRAADQLSKLAAGSDQPSKFDAAATQLGLPVAHGVAVENQPLTIAGREIPSVSAWAFGGAQPGETSDLIDSEDGYYLARLDSLAVGGKLTLDQAKDQIRATLLRRKKVEHLLPQGEQLAKQAASSSLQQVATGAGLPISQTPMFSRVSAVPGVGQANEVIGAAFAVPQGTVGPAIAADNGVYVFRVDRRVDSDRNQFDKIKRVQRERYVQALRQQRVRQFLDELRKSAKIKDNRPELEAAARRQNA